MKKVGDDDDRDKRRWNELEEKEKPEWISLWWRAKISEKTNGLGEKITEPKKSDWAETSATRRPEWSSGSCRSWFRRVWAGKCCCLKQKIKQFPPYGCSPGVLSKLSLQNQRIIQINSFIQKTCPLSSLPRIMSNLPGTPEIPVNLDDKALASILLFTTTPAPEKQAFAPCMQIIF